CDPGLYRHRRRGDRPMNTAALDPIRARRVVTTAKKLVGAIALLVLLLISAAIGFVVVSGRLDGRWYDFRDLGIGVDHLRGWLDLQNAKQPSGLHNVLGDHWMSYVVTALIGAIGILSFVGGVLLVLIWVERRLIGRIQVRRGPNR